MPTDSRIWPETSTRRVPVVLLGLAAVLLIARVGIEAVRLSQPARVYTSTSDTLVRWTPVDAAESASAATGKPILYEFTAEWCPPCKRMQREAFADPATADLINRSFVPVQVYDRAREEGRNADVVTALLDRHRVAAYPTLVVVRNGQEITRIEGYPGLEALGAWLAGCVEP